MVSITLRIAARGGLQVDPAHCAPPDRDDDLRRPTPGLMLCRITHDPGDDDRIDTLQAHRLCRCRGERNWSGLINPVLVGVPDDKPGRREREDGHVAAQFIVIEGCLMVDEIRLQRLAREGGIERVGHQVRVVPTSLNVATQLLVKLRHAPILPPARALPVITAVAAALDTTAVAAASDTTAVAAAPGPCPISQAT